MSVPNQIPESNYVGNGTTTTFAAHFEYASDSDVFVTVNGVTPEIGQATFANGVFTFITAPANGAAVRVYRNTPIERDTEYDSHDNVFRPKVVNIDFDRIWFVLQEYLLSLGIANAKITQEIADRIQADAEMMNYILNEDNELKADYILRDENLKKYVDQTIGAIIGKPDFQGIEARFVKDSSGKNQQEINDSLVGVGDKLKRENVSVWDFFTSAELDAYKASPTTFDAYRQIQAFFTYIAQNDVGTAYCSITACISQGLLMGVKGVHKTLVVNGNMQLTALNAIDTMIQREIGQDFEWVGFIYLIGHRTATSPSYTYRYRTCRVGMSTHLTYNNARQKWGGLRFMYFQQHGLQVRGATTASQYKYVRANGCGTGLYGDSRYRFETTFNNRVDTGTSGSSTQRTTITVAELPSSSILQDQAQNYIVVNNEPYLITAYDIDASTITVIPWIDLTVTSGTLSYMIGGGVDLRGGDSSAVQFGYVEGTNCGIMFNDCALYTANIGMLMAQANGCGYNAGSETGAATIGGTLDSMYIEGNHINLMFTSIGTFEKVIGNTYALDLAKVKVIAPRLANNTYAARTLGNGRLNSSGVTYTTYGQPNNSANNVTAIDIFDRRNLGYTYRHNNIVFAMPVIDVHKNSLTGLDNTFVKVIGTSASNIPTSVTFRPASGCTVNGSTADVVFSGFTMPPQFDIYAQISTGNYIVMCKELQRGVVTATYDPPSLAASGTAGDSVTTTVTLAGATVGAAVQAAFTQYNAAIEIGAQVSAANTVTVKFKNTSATAVDLPSGTLTVKLI